MPDLDADQLMPLVYRELRRLAASYLRREHPGGTIQATGLVHEAYLRLAASHNPAWRDRTHFLGIAARSMRQILVERARRRRAAKRGGNPERLDLDDPDAIEGSAIDPRGIDVLALDAALERLAAIDPERARVVELRFFAGLTVEETADALGTSAATVKRSWALARAWLQRELASGGPASA